VRALLFALLVGCVDATAPVRPGDDAPRILEVPSGASASGLAARLAAEGLVPSEFAWKWYLRSTDGGCLKAGRHEVRGSMSMAQLLEALCGVPIPDDEPFTIVEGRRMQRRRRGVGHQRLDPARGLRSRPPPDPASSPRPSVTCPTSLEGYLFPETYMVIPDKWDTKAFIQRQIDMLAERFYTPNAADIKASKRSFNELVMMASMLEREEPKPSQRPMVAGILWKRIASGWNLGSTRPAAIPSTNGTTARPSSRSCATPNDPYNSRLRPGLPPTAIGNPRCPASKRRSRPTESEYWYYLHDGEGKFHGGKSAAEHEANRARFNVY
jgi:UPF0755 protein